MSSVEIHAAETADAERVGARRSRDAGSIHRHEKRGHALAAQARPGAGKDDHHRRRLGVRHPDLAAGDAIAGRGLGRAGVLVGRVGSRIRLRQGERADRRPCRQPPQPPLLLRHPPGMREQLRDQRIGDGEGHGHRGARAGDRLDGEHVAHVIQPSAAPHFRNRHAQQPVRGRGLHHVVGKLTGFIDCRGSGRDRFSGEALDRRPEQHLLGG